MIPLLVARLSGEEEDVGDLEFIQDKVVAGDYFQVTGAINTPSSVIQFIVPDLKTAFLIEAKITITGHDDPAEADPNGVYITQKNAVQAELRLDTVAKDTANVGEVTAVESNSSRWGYGEGYILQSDSFNVLGLSLVGDGIKKIEIVNTLDNGNAVATMSGYVITT